jgi:hypothetical protein
MSNSQPLTTSNLAGMISTKNEYIFIRGFSNLRLQMTEKAKWFCIDVDWKYPIDWNNSEQAPSWRF